MTAQLASSTLLAYGPQGARQLATAALLSYSPPAGAQRVVASFSAPWAPSAPQAVETRAPMHHADALDQPCSAPWGHGEAQQRATRFDWVLAGSIDRERSAPWQQFARRLQQQNTHPWVVSRKSDAGATAPWGEFAGRPALTAVAAWVRAVVSDPQSTAPWGQYAGRPALALRPTWATARRADAERWIPWSRFGRQLDAGWGVITPPGGPPVDENGTVIVLIRRVYVTINSITLHRVDTGAELHAFSFSMSLDYQSWTWSWSASLHNDATIHLGRDSAGDPAELAVFVNGVEFRLRLESKSLDRRFSPTRWSVSGRGKACVLGSADAPKQSFRNAADRTAQQLMADVLTVNGVPMGWTVDWGLQDWLVPAGAWAMQGNYIDAINDIAGAAGGYVQPHNTAATLRVLPRYPLAPWHWGSVTPDFEIPADAAEVEGTQYIDKPAYNRVFVGGIGAGVFGPFTRAGTAGNVIAPQVNHPLITHADAHRQRGIAELSDTGKQERITLNMQVLPETGVIVPGQFVRYLGDAPVMGIVRATSIDWSRPRLRQTLEIETHA